ncbi:TonB-dependent receptor [Rhizorhabdus histidinilytica]|uniref:TonB-dependent receptor n=1 Tax=Rhizorhabdus histidinilytica TaxID=439228 RepID=UPI003220188D
MLLAGFAVAAPAFAQQTGEQRGLDDIVVTARRVEERLQVAPVAVTALSAATLEQRQVSNLTEVVRFAPNVQFSTAASGTTGASSVFIRGIGQADFITTTEPGVGVYVDGVYLARVTGAALDLADVERVEVLRGPQGTLYGRNTIGGAVNVVTKRPRDRLEGELRLTGGNQGRFEGRATISGPLGDGVSGRLSVLGRTDSGYGRNLVSQPGISSQMGRARDLGARVQLRIEPSDRFSIDLSGDYLRHRGTPSPHTLVAFRSSPTSIAYNALPGVVPIGPQYLNPRPDLDAVQLSAPMRDTLDVYGGALTATYELDAVTLKSISAYRHQDGQSGQDFDGTPAAFLDQLVDSRQWQFSQELQASGKALEGRLDWIVGGYYFEEDGRFDSFVSLSSLPATILTNNHSKSLAFYGQASYEIVPRLRLTLGGRYTDEKKSLDGITTLFGPIALVPPTDRSDKFRNFSPKVGLDYRVTDDLLVYGSVTRGFRSGGFNGRPFSLADLTPFSAEKVTSYEAGFKSELFGRLLRFNMAGFYNDYKDIQLTAVSSSGGASIVLTGNAASAEIYGFEAEIEARPVRMLKLFGSVGYMKNDLVEKAGFTFGATELPTAPKWTLSFGGQYDVPLSDAFDLSFGADVSHTSSFTPQFDPSPAARIPAYSLVNGRITLANKDDRWSLMLFVKNLFDKRYRTYAQTMGSQDATTAWFGPSRRIGIQAALAF